MDKHDNNSAKKFPMKIADPFKIAGDWYRQSKALQETFPQLTDADLKFQTGQDELLLNRMMVRLDKKREEVIAILKKVQLDAKNRLGLN